MKIDHIKLLNWRNFREVDVQLTDRVFLVGPNASGKSNFLDALKFLRDIARNGLQKAVTERGGVSKIRCLAARQDPNIELHVDLSVPDEGGQSYRYELGISQEPRGRRLPRIAFERVWVNGKRVLSRPNQDDTGDNELLSQSHLEQITVNASFRDVARFFESLSYMHLVPQLVRFPSAFSGPGLPGDPFGRGFLEMVARTTKKTRESRLRKIGEALRIAVPHLSELTFSKDESGVPHLEARYKHWRPIGARQREDQFSDGTLRLLALLWILLDGDSLLLLEEPELSLNVGIVGRLSGIIHRIQRQKRRQIIISTHSADLLADRGIGDEEVLILRPSQEGTRVSPASSEHEVRDLLSAGIPLGDIIRSYTASETISQLELFQ
jgi:predicted ATPase